MVAHQSAAALAAELLGTPSAPGDLTPTDLLDGYQVWESPAGPVLWPAAARDLPVLGRESGPPDVPDIPDAESVLLGLLPGWRPASAWLTTATGRTLGGWRFASVQRDLTRSDAHLTAMAVVLAGAGTQQVVWGLASPSRSVLSGGALVRLVHSLPPAASVHPSVLDGAWRCTSGYGVAEYEFTAERHFRLGMTADIAFSGQPAASVRTGAYRVVDGMLELADADGTHRYFGRLYDELGHGARTPTRTLSLMPAEAGDEIGFARVAR